MHFTTAQLILSLASFSVLYSFNKITANLTDNGNKTSFNALSIEKTRNVTLNEGLSNSNEFKKMINGGEEQLENYASVITEQDRTEKISDVKGVQKSAKMSSAVNKERTPVKLTRKQGLIMNQLLNTYGLSNVKNELCKNHTEEFKAALRDFEPWALKMFDASSKLQSGILNGNLADLGTYWQCLYIHEQTQYGPLRGRHCAFRVTPSDKLLQVILSYRNVSERRFKLLKHHVLDGTKLIWSVCVPDSCTHEDVFPHYNKTIMEVAQGLDFTLSLKQEHCTSLLDFPSLTAGDYLYMLFVASIVGIVFVCSLIHILNKGSPNTFVDLFSGLKNAKLLFSTNNENKTSDLGCLHGIRFLSMLYIVIGHRYQHNFGNPLVNSMELVEWILTYFSTTVFGGTTSVDTFLLVGSTVLSYNFFNVVYQTNQFSLVQFYLYRNLRMLMPLILTVSTYVTVMKHFGSGPLYYDFYMGWKRPCQAFWWSALLHIQGFVNPEFMCIPQTWYLGVDMFWYYISPIILVPLWKNTLLGYASFIIIYILSIAINFYLAWIKEYDGGIPVTSRFVQTDYFAHHYIQPYCRGSPYVLGLALGYALFKTKGEEFQMNVFLRIIGWILSFTLLIATVLISHMFHVETYEYDKLFSSLFLSCHRSVWTLALMWIIWCCEKNCGGIVNTILCHGTFKILGRLGYNIFLLHYLFQGAMQSSEKIAGYFSDFMMIYMALSDMVLSCGLSIIVTLCFEYPFVRMVALFMKSSNSKRKTAPKVENIKKIEEGK